MGLITAVTVTVTVIIDNSGQKCINKRCGGRSATKSALQYTRTDIHNYRCIVYDYNFRSGIVRIVYYCQEQGKKYSFCLVVILKKMNGKEEEIHNILVALLNGKEEEIYNILYKKKEIDDKTLKLRTEDEKKKLKSLRYKMRKYPKDLIDDIKKKFPFLQRTPKTAEQRKEQVKECNSKKRYTESEIDKDMRLNKQKEYKREPTFTGPLQYTI